VKATLGCGKDVTQALGAWVQSAVTITPKPIRGTGNRVYFVKLPLNYNKMKPYRLLFVVPGCNGSMPSEMRRISCRAGLSGSSPYLSITDAIKRWPESPARHAILVISDGVDPLQPGTTDSYLDQAVSQAQQTGTQVSAIYASGSGHFGHSLWRINQGQNNLSLLADQTGGEAYFQGFETPIAFAPFLDQFADRLNHQYKLTFLATAEKKPTRRHVRLETEVPNAELVTADKVYVPAVK